MDEQFKHIDGILETLSLESCMIEEGDIPGIEKIQHFLSDLEVAAHEFNHTRFSDAIHDLTRYLGMLVLNKETDVTPLVEGVTALQSLWRDIGKGKEVTGKIDLASDDDKNPSGDVENQEKTCSTIKDKHQEKKLSSDDIRILGEFIPEAKENLETIELKLIELEQNPDDMDTINAIFRPLHTLKGT